MEEINPLELNKTVVFYTPLHDTETLVRTATPDKNSFFHAVLHASMPNFLRMTPEEKEQEVKKLMDNLKLNSNWKSSCSIEPYKNDLCSMFNDFYKAISHNKSRDYLDKNNYEVYSVFCDLYSYEDICDTIQYQKEKKLSRLNKSLNSELKRKIKKKLKELEIPKKKISKLLKEFKKLLKKICLISEENISSLFSTTNRPVTKSLLKKVATKINRDIYILDSTHRSLDSQLYSVKYRPGIILLKLNEHYEVVGRLLTDNRVQRDFPKNDTIIDKFYTLLIKPHRISKKYPNLQKYVQVRSKEESDEGSDEGSFEESDEESDEGSLEGSEAGSITEKKMEEERKKIKI